MKRHIKRLTASAAAVALAIGCAGTAWADNAYVSGELNKSGSLVQYDYTRTHTFTGPISLSVNNMLSNYLRLGLRNMKASGGPQFTDSLQWNTVGAKSWDNILVGTRFAFQGRMGACTWFCDTNWGGNLTY